MACCFLPTAASKYAPTMDDTLTKPLISQSNGATNISSQKGAFPGMALRQLEPAGQAPTGDTHLIKTGGNALQAVSQQDIQNENKVAVTVPLCLDPGTEIKVMHPNGTGDFRMARIPEGYLPGHVFFVEFDPNETQVPAKSGDGVHAAHDLELQQEDQPASRNDMVLVKVLPSMSPGDSIRVALPDGRQIDATVPPGNVQEFYVQAPPSTNTKISIPDIV